MKWIGGEPRVKRENLLQTPNRFVLFVYFFIRPSLTPADLFVVGTFASASHPYTRFSIYVVLTYVYTYERVRKTSGRAVFVRRTIALKCKCNTNSPLKLPNAYTYHIITIIFTAGYTNTTLVYAPETVAVYTRYRYRCGRYVYE